MRGIFFLLAALSLVALYCVGCGLGDPADTRIFVSMPFSATPGQTIFGTVYFYNMQPEEVQVSCSADPNCLLWADIYSSDLPDTAELSIPIPFDYLGTVYVFVTARDQQTGELHTSPTESVIVGSLW